MDLLGGDGMDGRTNQHEEGSQSLSLSLPLSFTDKSRPAMIDALIGE
jgi:hypothetical protein